MDAPRKAPLTARRPAAGSLQDSILPPQPPQPPKPPPKPGPPRPPPPPRPVPGGSATARCARENLRIADLRYARDLYKALRTMPVEVP